MSAPSTPGKGRVSEELKQKIKDAVNLVEIVSEHVVLRKSGSNYSGLCPFHSERSPSFTVNEQKQLYHCYGCKAGGDLFRFVQEMHQLSFPEAIEELAARAKVALPSDWRGRQSGDDAARTAQQERLQLQYKVNRFVAAFYHHNLPRTKHVLDYFTERGVNAELQRNFYLGAALPSWDALASHLAASKAPVQVAVDLGLIKPSTKQQAGGPGYFDIMRNRAIFPILDSRGRVAGFGGRALPLPPGAPDVGGESPKYMNSSESPIFQKSKIAYGLFQAQKHIREKDEVILVEGYFDVLGMHAAGFENVVATCGTALTAEHLKIFSRLATKVTILFDGDKAGISATERAMEIGLEQGQILYGAAMPEGLDPDELCLQPGGKDRMREILAAAKPLLDARITDESAEARDAESKSQALKKVGAWLARYKDPVGRELRMQSLQEALGVSRQLVAQAMGMPELGRGGAPGNRSQRGYPGHGPSGPVQKNISRPTPGSQSLQLTHREQVLLGAIARGGKFAEIFAQFRGQLPAKMTFSDLFDYFPARDFVARLFQTPGALEAFRAAPEAILGADLDAQVRSIVTEALVAETPPFTEEEVTRALDRAGHQAWARFSQQVRSAMKEAEAKKDAGLLSKLSEEYLDARRRMEEFNSSYDEA